MNEKCDEPTKQPFETGQPEAQEQPEYREVSTDELKQILEAHRKWVESDGKEGNQADLIKANLQGANLFCANLQGADLRRVIVTASQIKEIKGNDKWWLAFYGYNFRKELGLPADHNETLKQKLAEIEEEEEKTTTQP